MKVACFVFSLALAGTILAGCGPQTPAVGNYATVFGQVTDATGNAPIAGASVTVNFVLNATTDQNGNYRIPNVPNGPWSWSASAANYQSNGNTNAPPLLPGEQRSFTIQLTHI
jgi:hypothetical protein